MGSWGGIWELRPVIPVACGKQDQRSRVLKLEPRTTAADACHSWDLRSRTLTRTKKGARSMNFQQKNKWPQIWDFQNIFYLMLRPKIWILRFKKYVRNGSSELEIEGCIKKNFFSDVNCLKIALNSSK